MFIDELDQQEPDFIAYILDRDDVLVYNAQNPGHVVFKERGNPAFLAVRFGKEHIIALREIADQLEADQD